MYVLEYLQYSADVWHPIKAHETPVLLHIQVSNCVFSLICLHSAALEVELSDDSFPPEDFGIVSGMLNVKWDRIAPYP